VRYRKGEGFRGVVLGHPWQSLLFKDAPHPKYQAGVREEVCQSCFAGGSAIHSDGYRSYIPALKGYVHEYKPYVLLHWL